MENAISQNFVLVVGPWNDVECGVKGTELSMRRVTAAEIHVLLGRPVDLGFTVMPRGKISTMSIDRRRRQCYKNKKQILKIRVANAADIEISYHSQTFIRHFNFCENIMHSCLSK